MRTASAALLGAMILGGLAQQSDARAPYKKGFETNYAENSKLMAEVKEAKCNVCHYGKTKKNRNDYGKALAEYLNKEVYTSLRSTPDKLNEKVVEVLKKVETKKKDDSMTFGQLIKNGSLPGTPPADAEADASGASEADDEP